MLAAVVTGRADRILRDIDHVRRSVVPKAASAAINRVARRVRADYATETGKRARISGRVVRKYTSVQNSKPSTQTGIVRMHRESIAAYKVRWARTARGVRFAGRIHRARFEATMQSGHTGIFARTGHFRAMRSGRYAGQRRETIREEYVELPDVQPTLGRVGARVVPRRFPREFDGQMAWRLRTNRRW